MLRFDNAVRWLLGGGLVLALWLVATPAWAQEQVYSGQTGYQVQRTYGAVTAQGYVPVRIRATGSTDSGQPLFETVYAPGPGPGYYFFIGMNDQMMADRQRSMDMSGYRILSQSRYQAGKGSLNAAIWIRVR